jgi:hypothetical protein
MMDRNSNSMMDRNSNSNKERRNTRRKNEMPGAVSLKLNENGQVNSNRGYFIPDNCTGMIIF